MLGLWHWVYVSQPHLLENAFWTKPPTVHRGFEVSGAHFGLFPSLLLTHCWSGFCTGFHQNTLRDVNKNSDSMGIHSGSSWDGEYPSAVKDGLLENPPFIYDAPSKPVICGAVPGLPSLTPKGMFVFGYSDFRNAPSSDPLVMTNSSLLKMVHRNVRWFTHE